MKIGIHIEPQMGYTYDDIVVLAKAAEDAGFYSLEVMLRECISGTIDTASKEISQYKNTANIIILGLPMMGDLQKNGLDTIKILEDHIIPRL